MTITPSIGKFLLSVTVLTALLPGCHKDTTAWKPDVLLMAKPDSGLTTQTFDFRIDIPNLPKTQEEFYVRWNFRGDSVWEASFTAIPAVTHRFYQKGDHTVKAEILTEDGQRITLNKKIRIDQGYSAPHAAFTIDPPESNYLTEFTFDASSTFDDEDSVTSLLFKWDFDNDGAWDTDPSHNPITKHTYKRSGNYSVNLNVTDPTRRVATESKMLVVNLHDELIHPDFTSTPAEATVKDTFLFDASATRHETDAGRIFSYSWDVHSEVTYGPFTDPQFYHVFRSAGMQTVILTVTDQFGLSNSITKEVLVYKENKPPTPKIFVATPYGNITTNFYLTAWPSLDDVTPPSRLLIRWDFEGDGNWDTGWTFEKIQFHQFTVPGEFWVTLEAQDEGGEKATAKTKVWVSQYAIQTGFMVDRRDGKYYGTVKIGDQWWMSDNLDYRTNPKMDIPWLQKCYDEGSGMCDLYGSLYQGERSVVYTEAGKNICPDGWRLPTMEDWMKLGEQIPLTGGRDAMMVGGNLGFNARYTGFGLKKENKEFPVLFYGLYKEVKFLSISIRPFQSEYECQFYMGLQRIFDGVDLMWGDLNGYFYARCIKND